MGFIVTDALEVEVLNTLLNTPLSLRLFSNNFTPIGTMAIGSFTEVAGGGYAAKPILFAGWTIVSGVSRATFSPLQQWTFTGPPSGPGTVYGYYLTRDSDSRVYFLVGLLYLEFPELHLVHYSSGRLLVLLLDRELFMAII